MPQGTILLPQLHSHRFALKALNPEVISALPTHSSILMYFGDCMIMERDQLNTLLQAIPFGTTLISVGNGQEECIIDIAPFLPPDKELKISVLYESYAPDILLQIQRSLPKGVSFRDNSHIVTKSPLINPPLSAGTIAPKVPEPAQVLAINSALLDAPKPLLKESVEQSNDSSEQRINIADAEAIQNWAKGQGFTYLFSFTNKEQLVERKLFIDKVALLGTTEKSWGVYTSERLEIGTVLGEYKGEKKPFNAFPKNKLEYVFKLSDEDDCDAIDASMMRNWTAMVNSAPSEHLANITTQVRNGRIYYVVLRALKPNEPLSIYYSQGYVFEGTSRRFMRPTDNWHESTQLQKNTPTCIRRTIF